MSGDPHTNGVHAPSRATRCILWHPADAPPPRPLLDSLARRGVAVCSVTDAFDALARVLAAAREPATACILLLVHPARLPEPEAVLAGIARHAPGVACWTFDPAAAPMLRPMAAEEIFAHPLPSPVTPLPPKPAPAPPAAAPRGGPALRLATDAQSSQPPRTPAAPPSSQTIVAGPGLPPALARLAGGAHSEHCAPRSSRHGAALTPEELAMLLSDEPLRGGTGGLGGRGESGGGG